MRLLYKLSKFKFFTRKSGVLPLLHLREYSGSWWKMKSIWQRIYKQGATRFSFFSKLYSLSFSLSLFLSLYIYKYINDTSQNIWYLYRSNFWCHLYIFYRPQRVLRSQKLAASSCRSSVFLIDLHEDHLTLNEKIIYFVCHVKHEYLGVIFEKMIPFRLHIKMFVAKAIRTFIRIYPLVTGERLSADKLLIFHEVTDLIRSDLVCTPRK
jgi:hypothetical protein